MVAKITVPKSIRRALNYNEQKVQEGKGRCLFASGFLKEAEALHFNEKLARFKGLIQLNERARTNTVHISLNFAAEEHLPPASLCQIARLYMGKIGFGDQPFLVYEHFDAAHPHLHILTTNIQRDGRRISLHNLGRNASEKARKELEIQFGLVRAGTRKAARVEVSTVQATTRAIYGKAPTKSAISQVLEAVLPHYKYASLAELNAILQRYHVRAEKGGPNSLIHRQGGLLYQMLDNKGKKVGVPIKASAFNQATLSFLKQKFQQHALQKRAFKRGLQTTLDWILIQPPRNLPDFEKALQKENISLVVRINETGFVYGLTFIDHRTKCVFNGSDLGKAYSAKEVLEKCGIPQVPLPPKMAKMKQEKEPLITSAPAAKSKWSEAAALHLLEQLLRVEQQDEAVPFPLRKQKKRNIH